MNFFVSIPPSSIVKTSCLSALAKRAILQAVTRSPSKYSSLAARAISTTESFCFMFMSRGVRKWRGTLIRALASRGDHLTCMKKERTSPMHSVEARPKACRNTVKDNAPISGASPLTYRSYSEKLDVFRLNDLLALMLNCLCQLRLGGGGLRTSRPTILGHAGRVTLPSV